MQDSERMKWFREARFGLYFHFGVFSTVGRNEWTFYLDRWNMEEYKSFAKSFTASGFDPKEWARLAVESGAKYGVLTARHHEGFSMYDSQVSEFNSMNYGPQRDFVAEYVEAFRAAGLKVGLYYSLVDWRYKGAWDSVKYPESKEAMVEQAHAQVEELMTRYGKIDLLWYDGPRLYICDYPQEITTHDYWRTDELNAMARRLQPHIIINDRCGRAEDFDTPEGEIVDTRSDRFWESNLPLDPLSWSYVPYSPNKKTAATLVYDMLDIAAGAGNLLLNTGVRPDGTINPDDAQRIRELGDWINTNAEAIYGSTRSVLNEYGSPYGPASAFGRWIGSDDPRIHYYAARSWIGSTFIIPRVDAEINEITFLATGEAVQFSRGSYGRIVLENLPETIPYPYATVFKVSFKEAPKTYELPPIEEIIGGTL